MSHKTVVFALVLTVSVSFASALGGGEASNTQLSGSISIAGSSTVFPISAAVAEEFSRMNPRVEIPIQSTGTGGGFKNFFIPGKTDINNASRRIKDSEIDNAMANGIEVVEIQVATDAITIVVNNKNDWLDSITVEQLKKIWRPENPAIDWNDVNPNWPNEVIELYGPTSASGTFAYFTEEIIGEEGASRSDYQGTEQDNTIVQAVTGSQFALGYFGLAYYLENSNNIKALALDDAIPSLGTAKSGEYTPLSRPIFIYVNKKSFERPGIQEFIRFYIEQTSTSLISDIGYVPLTEKEMKNNLAKVNDIIAEVSR